MATLFELQQAQQQKKAQQQAVKSAIIGSTIETLGRLVGSWADMAGQAVGAIGGTILGLSQFFQAQKQQKIKEKIATHQKFVSSNVDSILSQLENAGNDLINNKGFNPTSGDFEQALYTFLYPKIGYLGNCNINVWLPGPPPPNTDPEAPPVYVAAQPLQTWFSVKNGSLIATSSLLDPPPNIDTYWTIKCKNIHDSWLMAYQDQLVAQGRTQEAKALQASMSKSILSWQIIFGIAVAILIVIIFFRSTRIK